MIRTEGVFSLYKGLTPNLIQIVPHTGLQFAFFNMCSQFLADTSAEGRKASFKHPYLRWCWFWLTGRSEKLKLPFMGNLFCGAVAGLLAKTAVYPLDLAKKRLQVCGFEEARKKFGRVCKCIYFKCLGFLQLFLFSQVRIYSGMSDCLRKTFMEEGLSGLYKGLAPSCLKAMVTSALIFTTYEELTCLFKSYNL